MLFFLFSLKWWLHILRVPKVPSETSDICKCTKVVSDLHRGSSSKVLYPFSDGDGRLGKAEELAQGHVALTNGGQHLPTRSHSKG